MTGDWMWAPTKQVQPFGGFETANLQHHSLASFLFYFLFSLFPFDLETSLSFWEWRVFFFFWELLGLIFGGKKKGIRAGKAGRGNDNRCCAEGAHAGHVFAVALVVLRRVIGLVRTIYTSVKGEDDGLAILVPFPF